MKHVKIRSCGYRTCQVVLVLDVETARRRKDDEVWEYCSHPDVVKGERGILCSAVKKCPVM